MKAFAAGRLDEGIKSVAREFAAQHACGRNYIAPIDAFARIPQRSEYTDIPGAMMLASEYLREIPSGSRVMLVFSDMREDLPKGATRRLGQTEFEGIQVVALNVKRLAGDNADPERFRSRLAQWEQAVTKSGALGWRTLMDASKLPSLLEEIRS